MNTQKTDFEEALTEIRHAYMRHGSNPRFWEVCDDVEERLIENYPKEEVAIIEMVAKLLVHLGVPLQSDLNGSH